jgi:hypothetical protein
VLLPTAERGKLEHDNHHVERLKRGVDILPLHLVADRGCNNENQSQAVEAN